MLILFGCLFNGFAQFVLSIEYYSGASAPKAKCWVRVEAEFIRFTSKENTYPNKWFAFGFSNAHCDPNSVYIVNVTLAVFTELCSFVYDVFIERVQISFLGAKAETFGLLNIQYFITYL